jgi:hypothetical protein
MSDVFIEMFFPVLMFAVSFGALVIFFDGLLVTLFLLREFSTAKWRNVPPLVLQPKEQLGCRKKQDLGDKKKIEKQRLTGRTALPRRSQPPDR